MKGYTTRMSSPSTLFLIFNRPDTTARVFEAIRAARPPRLYIAADGPRPNREGDAARCEEARRIATQVDWPCEVKTLFRDRNLGCRLGVSTGIDWFFEHEEEGIVLEDDCLPSQSFFPYCAELLARYRHDERVMCVSGDNYQMGRVVTSFSYYFSRYTQFWGWASWRRAWKLYDREMTQWPAFRDGGGLKAWSAGDKRFEMYWLEIFESVSSGAVDTWDYQFQFTCWAHHGLGCVPAKNLITNIGFSADATHTLSAERPDANLPRLDISFPLRHPPFITRSVKADLYEQKIISDRRIWPLARKAIWAALPNPLIAAWKTARRLTAKTLA
jgi:hypothetical protein